MKGFIENILSEIDNIFAVVYINVAARRLQRGKTTIVSLNY